MWGSQCIGAGWGTEGAVIIVGIETDPNASSNVGISTSIASSS